MTLRRLNSASPAVRGDNNRVGSIDIIATAAQNLRTQDRSTNQLPDRSIFFRAIAFEGQREVRPLATDFVCVRQWPSLMSSADAAPPIRSSHEGKSGQTCCRFRRYYLFHARIIFLNFFPTSFHLPAVLYLFRFHFLAAILLIIRMPWAVPVIVLLWRSIAKMHSSVGWLSRGVSLLPHRGESAAGAFQRNCEGLLRRQCHRKSIRNTLLFHISIWHRLQRYDKLTHLCWDKLTRWLTA